MQLGGLIDGILEPGGLIDRVCFNLLKKATRLLGLALKVDVLLEGLPLLVELVKRLGLEERTGVDALSLQVVTRGLRGGWRGGEGWGRWRVEGSDHAPTSFS